jgi:hypothetical protein
MRARMMVFLVSAGVAHAIFAADQPILEASQSQEQVKECADKLKPEQHDQVKEGASKQGRALPVRGGGMEPGMGPGIGGSGTGAGW